VILASYAGTIRTLGGESSDQQWNDVLAVIAVQGDAPGTPS
jgi:hypothetical protein